MGRPPRAIVGDDYEVTELCYSEGWPTFVS
uniref:Uncharacterized protein n=1 Tax=Musa acuminata subsp. malaccensis TaxID=214687 RepID=A0A804KFX4_MUSAM